MARAELLDHGYLEVIETWGSEERIIEAARMSTGKGFLGWGPKGWKCTTTGCDWQTNVSDPYPGPCPKCGFAKSSLVTIPGDEKLLRYLWENQHATPFEMAGATFEVQAPIFVFREWHRHRVPFGYNEMSARYAPLPDVNYVPTVERLMLGGGHLTKQAGTVKGAKELSPEGARVFREILQEQYEKAQRVYEYALESGVPKELARVGLPVGRYSRMRATANLRGWLAFLRLRAAPTAQYEIRVYAEAVHAELSRAFPRTLALFDERAQ